MRAGVAQTVKAAFSIWGAIGRTTPWDNEESPPTDPLGATDIEEAIVFVKPQIVSLAKTVTENEDVIVEGQKYAFVADEDAIAESARFIYIYFLLQHLEGMPTGNFRQKGFFVNLVPAPGHENDQWLAPANVSDRGLLGRISNTVMRSFGPGEERDIEFIWKFE